MTCHNGQKFVNFRREVHELPGRISRNCWQSFEYQIKRLSICALRNMQNSAKLTIRRSLADIARPIALRKIFTAIERRSVLPQQHLILLFRQVSPLPCYIETQGRTAGKWKHPAQRLRRQTESFRPEMKRKSSFLLFFARLFVTLRTKK